MRLFCRSLLLPVDMAAPLGPKASRAHHEPWYGMSPTVLRSSSGASPCCEGSLPIKGVIRPLAVVSGTTRFMIWPTSALALPWPDNLVARHHRTHVMFQHAKTIQRAFFCRRPRLPVSARLRQVRWCQDRTMEPLQGTVNAQKRKSSCLLRCPTRAVSLTVPAEISIVTAVQNAVVNHSIPRPSQSGAPLPRAKTLGIQSWLRSSAASGYSRPYGVCPFVINLLEHGQQAECELVALLRSPPVEAG